MKFTASVATALLCADITFAARGTAMRRDRAAKKLARTRGVSNVLIPVTEGGVVKTAEKVTSNGTAHVEYSQNWAGAVLIGSGYSTVAGTITVPTPSAPSDSDDSTEYCASAWVGIDGDTCTTAILQTGVDFCVQGGSVSYDAWYEWYPDYAYDFSDIDISAGDQIQMTVTASSTSAGTAVIENLTTGQTVEQDFSGESNELCQTNAEWIVEDFESSGSLVSFADFDSVTFTDLTPSADGADILDIEQNSEVLTDCSASSDSVTCTYV